MTSFLVDIRPFHLIYSLTVCMSYFGLKISLFQGSCFFFFFFRCGDVRRRKQMETSFKPSNPGAISLFSGARKHAYLVARRHHVLHLVHPAYSQVHDQQAARQASVRKCPGFHQNGPTGKNADFRALSPESERAVVCRTHSNRSGGVVRITVLTWLACSLSLSLFTRRSSMFSTPAAPTCPR